MKKCQKFLSENFHFEVVKFSVHLNRRVFVMACCMLTVGGLLKKNLNKIT